MGKYDKAIEDFTGIIAIDENNVEAYKYRAITYFNTGEYEMAKKDIKTLEKLGYKMNEKFLKDLYEKNGKTRNECIPHQYRLVRRTVWRRQADEYSLYARYGYGSD